MMGNQKRVSFDRALVVLIVTIMMIAGLSVTFDFYYDLNDDTAIKDIISGTYTGIPSGYCIQMLYPLSFILAVCYRAIPAIPWYGLFLCVCQYAVFALIADRLIRLMKNKIQMVIALAFEVLIILGLCFRQVVIIQYSVTSGICMTGAIFLFITEDMTDTAIETIKRHEGKSLEFQELNVTRDVAKVSIVGAGMMSNAGVAAKMFSALSDARININMISTSEIKVSVLIDIENADKAVSAIHAKFFE